MVRLRQLLAICLLCLPGICFGQAPSPGSISGTLAGPDASGATVKLASLRSDRSYQTVASSSGTFHFASVDPGLYVLFTEGDRHQYSEYGAKGPGLDGMPIVLTAGQQLRGLDFQTYARSALCGRVLDYNGNPSSGVEVLASGATYDDKFVRTTWQKHAVTNAQGRYSIPDVGPQNSLDLWAQVGDQKTRYPSASETGVPFQRSVVISLRSLSAESPCIYDIYLPSAEGKNHAGFNVSGIVEGKLDPSLGDKFFVKLDAPIDQDAPFIGPLQISVAGSFELHNVWPGRYTLTLAAQYGKLENLCPMPSCDNPGYREHVLASQQITITTGDLTGLTLTPGTLPKLEGEVLFDSKGQGGAREGFTLMGGGREIYGNLNAENRFSFDLLNPGDYRLSLGSEATWFTSSPQHVQSMELDGKPIDGRVFQLHYGQSAHLIVRMASDNAWGTLSTTPIQPPPGHPEFNSTIYLMVPDPLPADNSGIRCDIPNAGPEGTPGHFGGVPPGSYRVLAVENLVPPDRPEGFLRVSHEADFTTHDAWVHLAALGNPVIITARQHFELAVPRVTVQMRRMMADLGLPATH